MNPSPGAEQAFAGVVMVPMLPCGDVDEMADFWTALGLARTYRQVKPNPYIALARGGFELHYYAVTWAKWDAAESHSTCGVQVPDTGALFEVFAAGLRERYGRLPMTGFPRITRPRPRANNAGLSGFSLVDPAGNWIRVTRTPVTAVTDVDGRLPWTSTATTPLGRALENAIVIGDSHGDTAQALKVLRGALARAADDEPAATRATAEEYAAELAARTDDGNQGLPA